MGLLHTGHTQRNFIDNSAAKRLDYTGWPKKTSRTLRNYNGTYTSWGKISFGTFVDQHVLLLTYKFQ